MIEGDEEDELLAEDHTKSTSYYLSKIFGESSFIVTLFQSTFHPDFSKLDNVFYASFARDKKHFFETSHDWYFSKSTRERILDFLLKRKRFSDNLNDDFAFGIARLIKLGVYTDAYPLHDGSLEDEGDQPPVDLLLTLRPRFGQVSAVPGLGEVRQLVQVPAAGRHQEVLRGQDRSLLRLAGLLHQDVDHTGHSWTSRIRIRRLQVSC